MKIAAWEREKSVERRRRRSARRRDLAKLEAQRDALDEKPPPAQGSFFRYTVKEIRESLGKDPAIEADMLAYYKAVNDHNRVAFADRVPPPAAAGPGELRRHRRLHDLPPGGARRSGTRRRTRTPTRRSRRSSRSSTSTA